MNHSETENRHSVQTYTQGDSFVQQQQKEIEYQNLIHNQQEENKKNFQEEEYHNSRTQQNVNQDCSQAMQTEEMKEGTSLETDQKTENFNETTDPDTTMELILSKSVIPYEQRFINLKQIYKAPMSPTIVYIAHDRELNKKVVLKKVMKTNLSQALCQQALREQQIAMELKHFNILQTHSVFETDTEYAVTMEIVSEADYFQEKLGNPPRPIKNEVKLKMYLYDILQGLNYMHKKGYVHLDIKPSNLFCWREIEENYESIRRVKLADFGLARKLGPDGRVLISESCGTYGFIAPEVHPNSYVTPKADIWSLGITLYLMVVAYMPHYMKGYKYGEGEVPFRAFDWKKKSPYLQSFAKRLLQINPDNRPTAEECLKDPFFDDYHQQSDLIRRRSSCSKASLLDQE